MVKDYNMKCTLCYAHAIVKEVKGKRLLEHTGIFRLSVKSWKLSKENL